jgi:uncharacterized membrane protein
MDQQQEPQRDQSDEQGAPQAPGRGFSRPPVDSSVLAGRFLRNQLSAQNADPLAAPRSVPVLSRMSPASPPAPQVSMPPRAPNGHVANGMSANGAAAVPQDAQPAMPPVRGPATPSAPEETPTGRYPTVDRETAASPDDFATLSGIASVVPVRSQPTPRAPTRQPYAPQESAPRAPAPSAPPYQPAPSQPGYGSDNGSASGIRDFGRNGSAYAGESGVRPQASVAPFGATSTPPQPSAPPAASGSWPNAASTPPPRQQQADYQAPDGGQYQADYQWQQVQQGQYPPQHLPIVRPPAENRMGRAAALPAAPTPLPMPQALDGMTPVPTAAAISSHVGWFAADHWGTITITMSATAAAGLSYLFGLPSGFVFYFTERQNRYVRFHAMQSMLLSVFLIVMLCAGFLGFELLFLTNSPPLMVLAEVLAVLVGMALVALWLFAMLAAWTGHYLFLPVIGNWADHFSPSPHDPLAMPSDHNHA